MSPRLDLNLDNDCIAGPTLAEGGGAIRFRLELVYQLLYTEPMSRSATLPPIRVTSETKASLEAVLREGESLTQFIENAVRQEAEFRAAQKAAVARAKKALRLADKGVGLMSADDFLAGMQERAQAAQHRIRLAVAAKNK